MRSIVHGLALGAWSGSADSGTPVRWFDPASNGMFTDGVLPTPHDDVVGLIFRLRLLIVLLGSLLIPSGFAVHIRVTHIRFDMTQADGKPIAVEVGKSGWPERHHMLLVGKYTTM